jgi:hypothetical protein
MGFSLHKDTSIGERANLQFRTEFFNILNHANFNTPNQVVFTPALSPTAGLINQHFHHVAADSVRIEAALVTHLR